MLSTALYSYTMYFFFTISDRDGFMTNRIRRQKDMVIDVNVLQVDSSQFTS